MLSRTMMHVVLYCSCNWNWNCTSDCTAQWICSSCSIVLVIVYLSSLTFYPQIWEKRWSDQDDPRWASIKIIGFIFDVVVPHYIYFCACLHTMYLQVISTLAFGKKQVCPRTGLLLSLSAQFFVQLRRRDVMVVSVAIFFLSSLAASGGVIITSQDHGPNGVTTCTVYMKIAVWLSCCLSYFV